MPAWILRSTTMLSSTRTMYSYLEFLAMTSGNVTHEMVRPAPTGATCARCVPNGLYRSHAAWLITQQRSNPQKQCSVRLCGEHYT